MSNATPLQAISDLAASLATRRHPKSAYPLGELPYPDGGILDWGDVLVIAHVGAGYHAPQRVRLHEGAAADAVLFSQVVLKADGLATEAASAAIILMEDNPITNAGYGSNLTEDGEVRGDAIIVDWAGRSGAVAALPRVRNPIQAANAVLKGTCSKMSLNRIPPILVAGGAGASYIQSLGGKLLPNSALLEPNAHARWRIWKRELDLAERRRKRKGKEKSTDHSPQGHYPTWKLLESPTPERTTTHEPFEPDHISDTVGVICLDAFGRLAAGASSGGLGLKKAGRVGPASILGAGAFVQPALAGDPRQRSVAVVTSGSGEYIITTQAASRLADRMFWETTVGADGKLKRASAGGLQQIFTNFIKYEFLAHPAVPADAQIGALVVITDRTLGVSILSGHNSPSLVYAWGTGEGGEANRVVSRVSNGNEPAITERIVLRRQD